ncbi:MAG: dihydrofolate reductase family protein [Pseudomonadota bacterium]|nr:dihydrofolate reductase family protein [Pseudomonadota bacterium]
MGRGHVRADGQAVRRRLRPAARPADIRHFRGALAVQPGRAVGAKFQKIRKYVVTSSDDPLEWDNSQALRGDPADSVEALKAGDGPDLLIQGSSEIYPPLFAAGLVDRLTLITFPVILGRGKRLFGGDGAQGKAWSLAEHHVSTTGVIIATYDRGGEVPIGSFASKEPSEAEFERRRKMEAGTW